MNNNNTFINIFNNLQQYYYIIYGLFSKELKLNGIKNRIIINTYNTYIL